MSSSFDGISNKVNAGNRERNASTMSTERTSWTIPCSDLMSNAIGFLRSFTVLFCEQHYQHVNIIDRYVLGFAVREIVAALLLEYE